MIQWYFSPSLSPIIANNYCRTWQGVYGASFFPSSFFLFSNYFLVTVSYYYFEGPISILLNLYFTFRIIIKHHIVQDLDIH